METEIALQTASGFFNLTVWHQILIFLMSIISFAVIAGLLVFVILFTIKTISKYKTNLKIGKVSIGNEEDFDKEIGEVIENEVERKVEYFKYFEDLVNKKDKQINILIGELEAMKEKITDLEIRVLKQDMKNEAEKIRIPLSKHPLFFKLEEIISNGPELDMSSLLNQTNKIIKFDIFKTVIISRNKAIYKYASELIKQVENPDFSQEKKEEIILSVGHGFVEWNKKSLLDLETTPVYLSNGEILKSVPKCFIEKFSSWDNSHTQSFFNKLKDILFSDFYKSWQIKVILLLDVLDVLTSHSSIEAKHTLSMLNGELDKELKKSLGDKYK